MSRVTSVGLVNLSIPNIQPYIHTFQLEFQYELFRVRTFKLSKQLVVGLGVEAGADEGEDGQLLHLLLVG